MLNQKNPIGIIDTGVGGLTVVKEIQKLLPNENIIYIGDSLNCPYGIKSENEIIDLTKKMLDFLKSNNVKAVAIACNTISSALNGFINEYDFHIESIICPTVNAINNIKSIGILGTDFTVNSGYYSKIFKETNAQINVFMQSSHYLASLIENGNFASDAIEIEIKNAIDELLSKSNDIHNIILACTHYPIVKEVFENLYPNINFINPAKNQAMEMCNYLKNTNQLNQDNMGEFSLLTTGDLTSYKVVSDKLNIKYPKKSQIIQLSKNLI